jgi:hypothetical protein
VTAVPKDPAISELRELFRNLSELRIAYETSGVEEIISPLGNRWSLWDIDYLYKKSQELLTPRQRQAISLCLVHNMRERQAAEIMGVSSTNPVMMYATLGIRRLLDMIEEGRFERFHRQDSHVYRQQLQTQTMLRLAERVQTCLRIEKYTDCWLFPILPGQQPRIRVKTPTTSSGFLYVDVVRLVYEIDQGRLPQDCYLVHVAEPPRLACVRPDHMEVRLSERRKLTNSMLLNYYRRSEKENHGTTAQRSLFASGEDRGRADLRQLARNYQSEREEGYSHAMEGNGSEVA